jgi:hypothetical protein
LSLGSGMLCRIKFGCYELKVLRRLQTWLWSLRTWRGRAYIYPFWWSLDFSSCTVLDVLEMSSCSISGKILSQSLRHLKIKDVFFLLISDLVFRLQISLAWNKIKITGCLLCWIACHRW